MAHPLSGAAAIVGLGITPQGRVYGNTPLGFAVDAVQLALADAGLRRGDLDGLLLNPGLAWAAMGMGSFQLQQAIGLRDLRLSATMHLGGAPAGAGRLPPRALDRRTVPPLRRLPGLDGRPGRQRDRPRADPRPARAAGLRPRHGAVAPGRLSRADALLRRAAGARAGLPDG